MNKKTMLEFFENENHTNGSFIFDDIVVYIEGDKTDVINFINNKIDYFLNIFNNRKELTITTDSGYYIESSKRFKTKDIWIVAGEIDTLYFEIKHYYKHDVNHFVNR